MSKSFFTGTEAELYSGSKNFSTRINLSPEVYGLSTEVASAYAVLDAEWEESYLAAQNPGSRMSSSVIGKNDVKVRLKLMASELARIIQANPSVTDEQRITLGLSVRAKPSPIGKPRTASRFAVTLDGNGALKLKWKCQQPAGAKGTTYIISRKTDGGEFVNLGIAGSKRFTDSTLPVGSTDVTYRIQAVRSTALGDVADFPVPFGVSGRTTTAGFVPSRPTELAA